MGATRLVRRWRQQEGQDQQRLSARVPTRGLSSMAVRMVKGITRQLIIPERLFLEAV